MIKEKISEDLICFIREKINDYQIHMESNSLLEDDLGITGEEASELIGSLNTKFHINIDNFIFSNYFYEEPSFFMNQSRKVKPLTIGHLVKAVEAGRLDEEIINS